MTILNSHPVLASFQGITLYTHGVLFALGAIVAFLVLYRYARIVSLPTTDLFFNVVMIFFVGVIGARIGYTLAYPLEFHSFYDFLAIWQGGLLSYTGILAGFAALYFLYRKSSLLDRRKWYDGAVLAALAGWSIGRIGNYYTAESGGIASSYWGAFYGHIPIQLFESILCLVLFIVLLIIRKRKQYQPGQLVFLGLSGYLVGRLIIDFWRDEGVFFWLHMSQWAALVSLIIVAWIWISRKK